MVIESLIPPSRLKEKPGFIYFLSMLYSLVSLLISYYLFPDPSIPAIFLTTIACVPITVRILMLEEKEIARGGLSFYEQHKDIFAFFFLLFLGFFTCFFLIFTLFPENITQRLFGEQIRTIKGLTGMFGEGDAFSIIIKHNFRLLAIIFFFSLLYGTGAVFIICWNSSLLAVVVGNYFKKLLPILGLHALPIAMGRFLVHGILEMLAYIIAGIAGGIVSAAMIRGKEKGEILRVFLDSLDLLVISSLLLIIAGIVEVTISPMIGI